MAKRKIYKCSFCGYSNEDKEIHILVKGDRAGICTDCVMLALTQILKKIPNDGKS